MRRTSISERRHHVTLANPATPVSDSDGGFTETFAALSPPDWWVRISPASSRDLERVAAGTVLSTASHIVSGPYHAGITTKTQITFGTRTFQATGVINVEERNIETVVLAVEVVD